MERLAFETDRGEIADPGARTLRNIVLVNVLILAVGIALGVVTPRREPAGAEAAGARTLEDGARPQPGRRF